MKKHWTRFLDGTGKAVIQQVAEPIEQRRAAIAELLAKVNRLEGEINNIENEAFEKLRDGGWSTEDIANAKIKEREQHT